MEQAERLKKLRAAIRVEITRLKTAKTWYLKVNLRADDARVIINIDKRIQRWSNLLKM